MMQLYIVWILCVTVISAYSCDRESLKDKIESDTVDIMNQQLDIIFGGTMSQSSHEVHATEDSAADNQANSFATRGKPAPSEFVVYADKEKNLPYRLDGDTSCIDPYVCHNCSVCRECQALVTTEQDKSERYKNLARHLYDVHNIWATRYTCLLCGLQLPTYQMFLNHVKREHSQAHSTNRKSTKKGKSNKLKKLPVRKYRDSSLANVYDYVQDDGRICGRCGVQVSYARARPVRLNTLSGHLYYEHNIKCERNICQKCNEEFPTRSAALWHVYKQHPDSVPDQGQTEQESWLDEARNVPVASVQASQKPRQNKLLYYRNTDDSSLANVRDYAQGDGKICKQCGEQVSNSGSRDARLKALSTHLYKKHGISSEQLICELCGEKFPLHHLVKTHMYKKHSDAVIHKNQSLKRNRCESSELSASNDTPGEPQQKKQKSHAGSSDS